MGGSPKVLEPIFQGPPVAPPAELSFRQDPSLVRDRLAEAFRMTSMGVLLLEVDVLSPAGSWNFMKPWPDDRTSFCFSLLYSMLPPTMAVTAAISRGCDLQVPNLNGGMTWIRFEHFTVTDALRLLVAEVSCRGLSARHTRHALNDIRLKDGESWETGINRLVQLARAAGMLPDQPYLAEETYLWRILTVDDLQHLMSRAVALCFPRAGRSPFEGHPVGVMERKTALLESYPIDTHALGSPHMQQRGRRVHDRFFDFVSTLGHNS